MLISTRVRKNPYWHLSVEAGCWRCTVYNRMYHPRGYVKPEDGGAMVEYDALVNHVTMWNVAVERQIRVKGPDAMKFTNYVITRDATRIEVMKGKYVILCNEKGGVLNDPILLRVAEDEFWFSLSDSDIMFFLQGVNKEKKRWANKIGSFRTPPLLLHRITYFPFMTSILEASLVIT
jgi:aminomethyltransferase